MRIFETTRNEVTGEWRRLHNEELYTLYCLPNIRVMKSRKLRWVGHVASMGREKIRIQGFGEKTLGKVKTRKTQA
jgi:hypothetical protein